MDCGGLFARLSGRNDTLLETVTQNVMNLNTAVKATAETLRRGERLVRMASRQNFRTVGFRS